VGPARERGACPDAADSAKMVSMIKTSSSERVSRVVRRSRMDGMGLG